MKPAVVVARVAVLSLLAAWAGGCTEPAPPHPADPELTAPFDIRLLEPAWEDCDLLVTALDYPSALVETKDDPEWPPSGSATTHVRLHGMDCRDVRWGAFHGPARLLFEWQTGGSQIPEACLPDGSAGTLQSLWVNDTALASTLQSGFDGLPVQATDIEVTAEALAYRWEWGPDEERSWVEVAVDPLAEQGPFDLPPRIYWFNETGVSFLDLEDNRYRPMDPSISVNWGNRLARGHLEPPMVGSSLGDYAAFGERGRADALEGRVLRFADHFCTSELP